MSRAYDIAAFRALIGPIKWEDNPILVKQKSRDFYWYSPVLKRQLAEVTADVMATPPEVPFLAADGDLWAAVDQMNQLGQEGLAVVDGEGRLVGMLTRDSVGEVVRARSTAQAEAAASARARR